MRFFLYNENQYFIPNQANIFGSTWDLVVLARCNRTIGCHRHFQISRIHWNAMDYEAQRCDETGEVSNTTHCLLGFIRDKMGCHIPIHNMEHLDFFLLSQLAMVKSRVLLQIHQRCVQALYHMLKL